ncbi:MAG TPA: hypothetical protein VII94_04895 [Candidatus Saccharimonadales bacterium]
MSYTPEQLIRIAAKYTELAEDIIGANGIEVKAAEKKEKKKLDPKAKVRNRGTVCVPAESAKDKKDHFPINDEGQARNALARVHQYSSVPAWYSGSLKGLQDAVSRKVHSKYPSIGKADKKSKKSSIEISNLLIAKYSQVAPSAHIRGWDPAAKETSTNEKPSINHVEGNTETKSQNADSADADDKKTSKPSKSSKPSKTSTKSSVKSPTSTEVKSPTSTSTEVRSPTSTSTEAYTADNFTATVTGGAGEGDTTVNIVPTTPSKSKSNTTNKNSSSLESYIEKFAEEYVYKIAQRQPISQVRNEGTPNEQDMMPDAQETGVAPKPPQVGVPDAVDQGKFPYISDAFQRQLLQAGKITRQQYDAAKASHAPKANWTPISPDVQTKLRDMGYKGRNGQPIESDGKLGQETRHALNVFKMKNGNPRMSDAEAINILNLGQTNVIKQYPMTNTPGTQPKAQTHQAGENVDP